MLNLPNLAWSVACLPWVLLACDRLLEHASAGRFAILAAVFALQALCGEPVTWASTGLVAVAYAIFGSGEISPREGGNDRQREKRSGGRSPSPAGSSPEPCLPRRSSCRPRWRACARERGALATPDFWSLHPFALWETVAPHLFGNYYDAFLSDLPWMGALNFGRDPFFYSLYVGPLVLLLAVLGLAARFGRNAFWLALGLVFLAAAFGGYTPLYPLARRVFPSLLYFRFPVKYIVISLFACAVLAAEGFAVCCPGSVIVRRKAEATRRRKQAAEWRWPPESDWCCRSRSSSCRTSHTRAARAFAESAHLKDPAAGAAFLARVAPPLLARALGLLFAGSLLVAVAARARFAAAALFIAVAVDLLVGNRGLNLTTDLAKLAPPAWYTASAGPERLYVGGRVRGFMNAGDPDATSTWQIPAAPTAVEGRLVLNAELPMAPSGWRVREALSYDLPYLWPAEYRDHRPALRAGGERRARRVPAPLRRPPLRAASRRTAPVAGRRRRARLEHARLRVRCRRDARLHPLVGGGLERAVRSLLAARGALRHGARRRGRAAGGDAGDVRRRRSAGVRGRADRPGRRHER